jgi:hypothetical protein
MFNVPAFALGPLRRDVMPPVREKERTVRKQWLRNQENFLP